MVLLYLTMLCAGYLIVWRFQSQYLLHEALKIRQTIEMDWGFMYMPGLSDFPITEGYVDRSHIGDYPYEYVSVTAGKFVIHFQLVDTNLDGEPNTAQLLVDQDGDVGMYSEFDLNQDGEIDSVGVTLADWSEKERQYEYLDNDKDGVFDRVGWFEGEEFVERPFDSGPILSMMKAGNSPLQ